MKCNFSKPLLMGIVNITPDSFSDGGLYLCAEKALDRIHQLIAEGADIIDIGAESTFGPHSQISATWEIERLKPVLENLPKAEVIYSVDTYKASVAEFALSKGVHMINDVTALRGDQKMIDVVIQAGPNKVSGDTNTPYICLMYSSHQTPYAQNINITIESDIISTIKSFLKKQTDMLINAGFPKENIIIDPGMGMFLSNDPKVSYEVLDRLSELSDLGYPILLGHSLKSFLGSSVEHREQKSAEVGKVGVHNGANILRVHNILSQRKCLERSGIRSALDRK